MFVLLASLLLSLRGCLQTRAALHAENLALRHQLLVLQRVHQNRRLRLRSRDRLVWVWLSRVWSNWRSALRIVKPETVIAWHRQGFRLYWKWKSRVRHGRPSVPSEVQNLIQTMSSANPRWGAPRIHGELRKLGIHLAQATVANTWCATASHPRKPGGPSWRIMPRNWSRQISLWFRLLYFGVTSHPTAAWTARQLVQAFPWDSAPRYLLRDRDRIYGESFPATVHSMGIHEVLTAPHSPWQNPYCERLIGSIRRECLDHFIIFNERSLYRTLRSYFEYYERSRTHLSLDKDAPLTRAIHPPEMGRVIELPQVGGLHHRYERRAA
jgi:putative transposase